MTILREHQSVAESDDLSIWTHTAFCITAAVILCFEVLHRSNAPDPDTDTYKQAIQGARERLSSRESDVLAQRGVSLIDAIFLEEGAIDFQRVVRKFTATNTAIFGNDLTEHLWESPVAYDITDPGGIAKDFLEQNDFDSWFNEVFNHEGNMPF
ncbi:hypothetical protein MBLNU459_g3199t2 [Dothideomycetes sp. NU459]